MSVKGGSQSRSFVMERRLQWQCLQLALLVLLSLQLCATVNAIPTTTSTSTTTSTTNNNNNDMMMTCDVEQLEHANDSQLFSILHDLKSTTFFKNFAVDLDANCPLSSLSRSVKSNNSKKKKSNNGNGNDKKKESNSSGEKATMPSKESGKSETREMKSQTTSTEPSTTDTASDSSSQSSTSTLPSSSFSTSTAGSGTGSGFSSSSSSSSNPFSPFGNGMEEEEGGCASPGLPDADPDDDEFSSCHVDLGEGEEPTIEPTIENIMMMGQQQQLDKKNDMDSSETESKASSDSEEKEINDNDEAPEEEEEENDDDDEYECTGGDVADEMDEDAEPLCHLTESELSLQEEYFQTMDGNGHTMSKTPLQDLLSSALNAVGQKMGISSTSTSSNTVSDDEKETFLWKQKTDPVHYSTISANKAFEDSCDDETSIISRGGRLPDTFWIDMCQHIYEGDGMKFVDLTLNPERNTGYNGTHIWRAIYEENCIDIMDGVPSISSTNMGNGAGPVDMCYEERVMYRLLSGLHASTTLSIAKNYYPPNKKKGRLTWESNPNYFLEKFHSHPEHIRNVHFSYVVLLRALKKASPILSNYEIKTGNIVDDEMATVLLRRLLDSSILTSCSDVFTAFDESLMFRPSTNNHTDTTGGGEGTGGTEENSHHTDIEEESKLKFPTGVGMHHPEQVITLQKNFKNVFHNISSILDCVQCQQCKLHGKMAMLGYGTALKILFMTNEEVIASSLSRNEIVAFINTVAKFSEALKEVRELTHLYWSKDHEHDRHDDKDSDGANAKADPSPATAPTTASLLPTIRGGGHVPAVSESLHDDHDHNQAEAFRLAIQAIDALTKGGYFTKDHEIQLVSRAIADDYKLLTIAKHYANDLDKFYTFSNEILGTAIATATAGAMARTTSSWEHPDAIVVGTGLAGLAATLNILDRGGSVLVIEKEHRVGGNSNKASSGINACRRNDTDTTSNDDDDDSSSTNDVDIDTNTNTDHDYIESFIYDTTKSAGTAAQPELIQTLANNSWNAVTWLKERVGVDLSLVAQLGGHAHKRTHRPKNGMVGAEIIYGVQKAVKEYEKSGRVKIMTDTKVLNLLKSDNGRNVTGVHVEYLQKNDNDDDNDDDRPTELYAPNVILATGGFAADRSEGSLLSKYRPELIKMPATAGPYSTGDGVALATDVGAGLIDMDKVQVHPTGWVDPKDPTNRNKVLAGELMRGVGGILMNKSGKRFCNELGTRAYVTDRMLQHDPQYALEKVWNKESDLQTFYLVLSSNAALNGKKHIDHYMHKGLVTRLEGIDALAGWMGQDVDTLKNTFVQYHVDAIKGQDEWGKTSFQGDFDEDLDNEVFFVGIVTPVLHYCMGGITIDKDGNVLDENGLPIGGLHAAGEVTGGVHGNNRLGGNSLLECTVYGTIVGKKIPIQSKSISATQNIPPIVGLPIEEEPPQLRDIPMDELTKHNTESDCWVAIHGKVYDLTDFAESHPPGAESIYRLGGTDGTEAFQSIHNEGMLEDFEDDLIGVLV